MPNYISIIFHYVPRFYKENLPSNCDQKTKISVNLKRATQAVPALNSSPPPGINHYFLCYRDFSEVVEKKGQCKTTSMEIASMYLQLTDLEAALIQGRRF